MKANLSGLVAILFGAAVACGGSTSGEPLTSNGTGNDAEAPSPEAGGDGSGDDAGAAADADAGNVDHGAPSSTYPAFMPDFGQLQYNGGYVMQKPVVVAVTWNSDPSQSYFDTFADTVGATSYWSAACSEYKVAAATCGSTNHVHLSTAAPAQITDQDLQNMVTMNAGAANGWPAPTQDTIYAFFLPPSTSLQMSFGQGQSGDACSQGVGGYHDQVTVGSVTTSYAVVPSCNFGGGNTATQQTTMSMSHELLEAVTDPHPQDQNPGWVGFDQAHFAFDWFQEFSDENGDDCEFFRQSFYEDKETSPASFDYWVQRTWSNQAGPAGHDPCQPAPTDTPYFNVTPLNLGMVSITLPAQLTGGTAQTIQVKGVHIPVGQTGTVELGFYSDGATNGPWTLSSSLGSPVSQTKPTYLTVSIDKTSGQNGEKAYATVKVNSAGTLKGELLVFHSTLNGVTHYMPVVIGSE